MLSNDEKKDWVYPPYKKLESTRLKPNQGPTINLIDTRLVDEFEKHTGVSNPNVVVVPFNYLFELVIKAADNNRFDNLRTAIQVAQVSHNIITEQQNETVIITGVTVDTEAPVEPPIEVPVPVGQSANIDVLPREGLSEEAKADSRYEFKNKALGEVVSYLKTSNWYAQNDAISELYSTLSPDDVVEDLFVLGRNIYQASEGGAFGASDYIRSLGQRVKYLTHEQTIILIEGIVFEAYFNSQGAFRQYRGKPDALPIVVEMLRINKPEWLPIVSKFILDELGANESQVLYRWFDGVSFNPDSVYKFIIVPEESAEFFNMFKVRKLTLNGDDITDKYPFPEKEEHTFAVASELSKYFHIPRTYTSVEVEGMLEDNALF